MSEGYIEVTVLVWKEGDWYIALEPLTGVASQGRSLGEAIENLREALELYLEEKDNIEIYPLQGATVTKLKLSTKKIGVTRNRKINQ